MFKFLKKVFWSSGAMKVPEQPKQVDVGRLLISVEEVDGTKHELIFDGKHKGIHPMDDSDWVFDADFYFRAWQRRAREHGMLSIGNDEYVPLCNVRRVSVIARQQHVVRVQD